MTPNKLPPLPKHAHAFQDPEGDQPDILVYTADQMHAYAIDYAASTQAKLDALMLEYCPDDMTPEQMQTWAAHQVPSSAAKAEALRQSQSLPAGAVAGLVPSAWLDNWLGDVSLPSEHKEGSDPAANGYTPLYTAEALQADATFSERHALDLRAIKVGEVLTQQQWDSVCAFVREQETIIDRLQADAREKGEAVAAVAAIDSLVADMYEHAARFQRENTEVSAVRGSMLCFADLIKMHVDRLATQPAQASEQDNG